MKSKKQYEDSAKMAFWSWLGLILIILFIAASTHIPALKKFHEEVGEKIKNDPRPLGPGYNYMHPSSWPEK